jgi:hypothetical protein
MCNTGAQLIIRANEMSHGFVPDSALQLCGRGKTQREEERLNLGVKKGGLP